NHDINGRSPSYRDRHQEQAAIPDGENEGLMSAHPRMRRDPAPHLPAAGAIDEPDIAGRQKANHGSRTVAPQKFPYRLQISPLSTVKFTLRYIPPIGATPVNLEKTSPFAMQHCMRIRMSLI